MLSFPEMENPDVLSVWGQKATLTFCWTNSIRKIKALFLPHLLPPLSPSQRPWMSAGHLRAQVSDAGERWSSCGLVGQRPRATKVCKKAQFKAHPVGKVFS